MSAAAFRPAGAKLEAAELAQDAAVAAVDTLVLTRVGVDYIVGKALSPGPFATSLWRP